MKYKVTRKQKIGLANFFRGFADAFTPREERVGACEGYLGVNESYALGLSYGKDMIKDAGMTNLSIGEYVDTALEETDLGKEES